MKWPEWSLAVPPRHSNDGPAIHLETFGAIAHQDSGDESSFRKGCLKSQGSPFHESERQLRAIFRYFNAILDVLMLISVSALFLRWMPYHGAFVGTLLAAALGLYTVIFLPIH